MLQRLAFVKGSKSSCCTPVTVSFDVKAMSFNYSYLIPGWGWEMEDGSAWFYWVGGS